MQCKEKVMIDRIYIIYNNVILYFFYKYAFANVLLLNMFLMVNIYVYKLQTKW